MYLLTLHCWSTSSFLLQSIVLMYYVMYVLYMYCSSAPEKSKKRPTASVLTHQEILFIFSYSSASWKGYLDNRCFDGDREGPGLRRGEAGSQDYHQRKIRATPS